MKTNFISFTGGIFASLLFFSFSPPTKVADYKASIPSYPSTYEDDPRTSFTEVSITEFRDDISRYNTKYAKPMSGKMPTLSWQSEADRRLYLDRHPEKRVSPGMDRLQKEPRKASRMFLYTVKTLEDFLELIREYGRGIPEDKLAIRFYYGVYPKGKIIAGENYGSQHTIFMVPNYWSAKDKQFRDVSIKHFGKDWAGLPEEKRNALLQSEDDFDLFIKDYFIENIHLRNPSASVLVLDASTVVYAGSYPVQVASLLPMLLDETVAGPTVVNQGQLCPPNCPPQSLLDNRSIDW